MNKKNIDYIVSLMNRVTELEEALENSLTDCQDCMTEQDKRIAELQADYDADRKGYMQSIIKLEEENERLRKVMDAAACIRHWHDSGKEGMVVSADHVRKLWAALDAAMEGEK